MYALEIRGLAPDQLGCLIQMLYYSATETMEGKACCLQCERVLRLINLMKIFRDGFILIFQAFHYF